VTEARTRTRARPESTLDLAAYSNEVEAFLGELGEEYFANFAGLKDELSLGSIYGRHTDLFSRDAVDALRQLAEDGSDEAPQARLLLAFATEGHLERQVVALTERIETAETQAIVIWRGERLPFRSVPHRVAEIDSRAERNALDVSYREAVEEMNPMREERIGRLHQLAVELGYTDYVDMVRTLRGIDPDALGVDLQRFLVESETVYFAALRRYLALIDIEQGDATVADMQHLLRGAGWDNWFDSRRMVSTLTATLAGMGIDLGAQRNVTLDVEKRPTKSPRAFCVAVRVPDDVRLIVQPRGGWDDFAAILHEAGHLEHFAHVDPQLPVAFRYLGDNSVTEGYAALFELLFTEPAWLDEHLRMPQETIAAFGDFAAFWRLWLMRRYCARLLYELRLHRDADPAVNRAYYAGLLGLLTGVITPEASYLADVDDNFYAAQYLRSWMLEASLAASLRRAHGPAWWRETAAGDTLNQAWQHGQEWGAEDVVAQLGYDRLDWRPVLRQIRTRLIGEMSGYGGPNITTRAGTRKV
jgi:hypothetical protein